MRRRTELPDNMLFEVATYLSRPEAQTEIHAELPARHRDTFEEEYRNATNDYLLPNPTKKGPYYVWPKGTNKQGRELRIYFARVPPEPPSIRDLYTDFGKWYAKRQSYRINHSNLVMQLFKCGFLLGSNTNNSHRISEFMSRRFPVTP